MLMALLLRVARILLTYIHVSHVENDAVRREYSLTVYIGLHLRATTCISIKPNLTLRSQGPEKPSVGRNIASSIVRYLAVGGGFR